MKKLRIIILLLVLPVYISACPSPQTLDAPITEVSSSNDSSASPSASPSIVATSTPNSDLDSLKLGILPDTSYSDTEKKLAGVLIRKTTPIFPLKIGVLLYKEPGILPDGDRRSNFDNFIAKLQGNPNIGQVIEISSNLIAKGADIETIRAIGARFQVSSVLVISESYQSPVENKEALITPIDVITGARTWESFSNIEVYALDILNGVFIFSTQSGYKENNKYSRDNSSIQNPDSLLIRNSAMKAWQGLENKVNKEVADYKQHLENNQTVPVTVDAANIAVAQTANP